ncbi:methyltransferase domain-containing protein [Neorhodopirellula lusitana]|uniref:methyltransferase domain-containing protein n=1 Tax=Neorhodopirellula lusitana TaxID=445327 RepID=UPI00384E0D05
MSSIDTEKVVRDRYSDAANARTPSLCCPIEYNTEYLKAIPKEIIERDYGCGDPSRHVRAGETVLDLGSGGGKICFIAAQVVGAAGKVIGVDLNDEMLDLARRSQPAVAKAIGFDNVSFRKGKIQDLAVDRDEIEQHLADNPVTDELGLRQLEQFLDAMRKERPMIADESVDVVVSNCVLNLVDADEKELLFDEILRALRPGGRAVISDIVADEPVPESMQADPELWSGCISGAFERSAFMDAFEQAGFVDVRLEELQSEPWQTVDGIAFRSATVIAYRPSLATDGEELMEQTQEFLQTPAASIQSVYRGPFKHVVDDEGRMYTRGETCTDALSHAAQREAIADQFVTYGADTDDLSVARPMTLPVSGEGCCGGGNC